MASGDNLGDLQVSVTGDFSELQTAIDQSVQVAQDGSQQIASALQAVSDASGLAGRDLEIFQGIVEADAQSGIALEQSLQDIAGSAATVGDAIAGGAAAALESLQTAEEGAGEAATQAAGQVEELGAATTTAAESAHEGEGAFGSLGETLLELSGIALTVEGLKELAVEALSTYANVEKSTIALTALTGSSENATTAIEDLKSLALQDALSFPTLVTAYQRMVAFGFSAEQIPHTLQAAADAAAATGRNIDQVTNSIDRLALSGTAGARQLATLGISLNDLAGALGVTSAEAAKAFKALDVTERLDIINAALVKYQGVAQAVAEGVAGQFQNLQTKTEFVFESIGQAAAPAAAAIMAFASDAVLPAAQLVANSFANLGKAESDFANTVATALPGAIVSAVGAMTGLKVSASEVSQAVQDSNAVANSFQSSLVDAFAPGVRIAMLALGFLNLEIQNITNTAPGADQMIQSFTNHLHALQSAAQMGGQSFQTAWNFSLIEAGFGGIDKGTQDLVLTQQQLRTAVDTASISVQTLTAMLQQGKTVTDSGVSTANLLAAAHVRLDAANKALATSIGESTKAAKDQKDSWDALVTTEQKNNDALTQATDTWDALSSAFNSGKDTVGGLAVNLKTLEDAANNVAAAFLKATGSVQQWDANAVTLAAGIQTEANQFTTLQNAVSKTSAVFDTLQKAYQDSVAAGTQTDQQLQILTLAFNDQQKAIGAFQKATEQAVGSLSDLTGIAADVNTVMVNGQAVTVASAKGFVSFSDAVKGSTDAITPFVGAVTDGTTKIGDMTISTNASTVALDAEGKAAVKAADGVQAHTAATAAADKAAQALAQHQEAVNKAWADGDIVVQKYNGDVVHVVGSANELNATLGSAPTMANGAAAAYQNVDGKMVAIAQDAITAKAAVDALNASLKQAAASDASWEAAGVSGLNGMKTSLASVLSAEMAIASDPAMAASGSGGVGLGQIDKMAQALADATGQIVTTLDGVFIPAAMRAAEITAAQSRATAAQTAATSANTTATTASTTATTTVTTLLTDQQLAYENQFNSLLTNTTATTTATTATTALATATTVAAAGAASLGTAFASVASATTTAANVTTAAATAAVSALVTTFGTITGAGSTPSASSILAGQGNLGDISGYGPNSQGYDGGQVNQQMPGGVNLTVNVTGNSVTSQALVDQLANKVGSTIITNLRTVAGFKL